MTGIVTSGHGLRNVIGDTGRPVTTSDTTNRTPITYATNVTGQRGKPGRGLNAAGGGFPRRGDLSPSVTVTERHRPGGGRCL